MSKQHPRRDTYHYVCGFRYNVKYGYAAIFKGDQYQVYIQYKGRQKGLFISQNILLLFWKLYKSSQHWQVDDQVSTFLGHNVLLKQMKLLKWFNSMINYLCRNIINDTTLRSVCRHPRIKITMKICLFIYRNTYYYSGLILYIIQGCQMNPPPPSL